jgi:hypothetical protein
MEAKLVQASGASDLVELYITLCLVLQPLY